MEQYWVLEEGQVALLCGVFLLFIGLVLALTMSEEKPTSFKARPRRKDNPREQAQAEITSSGDDPVESADEWYKQTEK